MVVHNDKFHGRPPAGGRRKIPQRHGHRGPSFPRAAGWSIYDSFRRLLSTFKARTIGRSTSTVSCRRKALLAAGARLQRGLGDKGPPRPAAKTNKVPPLYWDWKEDAQAQTANGFFPSTAGANEKNSALRVKFKRKKERTPFAIDA